MDGLPSVANRKHGAIFSQADRRNCMRGRIVGLYRECTGKWTCSSRALFQDSFWGMIAAAVESRASPIFVAFVIARGEIVDRDQTDALANRFGCFMKMSPLGNAHKLLAACRR